jgi:hypothetical protein
VYICHVSSHGPDRFRPSFLSTFWDTVSHDVYDVFSSSFEETIDMCCNVVVMADGIQPEPEPCPWYHLRLYDYYDINKVTP